MNDILEKIYESSLKLLVPTTPEETYKIIVNEAMRLVGADGGGIVLSIDGDFKSVYSSSPQLSFKPRQNANTYQTFITQKPKIVRIEDLVQAHPELHILQSGESIFVPLSYQSKTIGVLTLYTKNLNYFNKETERTLTLFSSMISLAIQKTHLYDEIKKALETRDLFISMAAHELRTPLTALSGYIQLLHSKHMKSPNAESRWVEQLYWESIRMTNLVNELLETNRIKSGQFDYKFKEVHFMDIVDRSLGEFQFIIPERNITLHNGVAENEDVVIGDFEKLLQVLNNLLENAAKFSEIGSVITVHVSANKKNIIVKIQDIGKGILRSDMDQVFDGYYRGSNHTKEGMGVGLFVVKNIIERHHGTINIFSRVNKGTTVTIKLPRVKL